MLRQAQQSIRWKRPIIHPLRKRVCNLTSREKQTLHKLFELNPAIGACHDFKKKLCDLLRLKTQNMRQCRNNIRKLKKMMGMLAHQALPEIKKTGVITVTGLLQSSARDASSKTMALRKDSTEK